MDPEWTHTHWLERSNTCAMPQGIETLAVASVAMAMTTLVLPWKAPPTQAENRFRAHQLQDSLTAPLLGHGPSRCIHVKASLAVRREPWSPRHG